MTTLLELEAKMEAKCKLTLENVECDIQTLLEGINADNVLDRLLTIQNIIVSVKRIEKEMKDMIDFETEMIAFNKTGVKKKYVDTTKEKMKLWEL